MIAREGVFERWLGLKQTIEVIYVVDGYIACLIDDATGTPIVEGDKQPTVLGALGSLGQKLERHRQ